jgi:ABC-type multidrug transport system ATPase subunit
MTQLKLTNLNHYFDQSKAGLFQNLNLTLRTGLTLVVGRNGSGKSSLFQSIFYSLSESEKRELKVSFLVQDFESHVLPWLSIEENIKFFAQGQVVDFLLPELLIQKSLSTMASNLSIGNMQLLGIYNCLAMKRDILLLDEPLSALDVSNRYAILSQIKSFSANSFVLISDHVLKESIEQSDNCLLVKSGINSKFEVDYVKDFGDLETEERNQLICDFYEE